jgi:hypothetical protein
VLYLALAAAAVIAIPVFLPDLIPIAPSVQPSPSGGATAVVESTPPANVATRELSFVVDGVSGDAVWRRGYRGLAERPQDQRAISTLALGPEACRALAIVALGSASSDGNAAANASLALRRARWLGEWTAAQLASCEGGSPAIIATSVGQARERPASAAQRRLRLFALDARGLASVSSLRAAVGAGGGFEACVLRAGAVQVDWLRPCA